MKKYFVIDTDSKENLMRCFNRHVIDTHEETIRKNSKYESFWLDKNLCQQPHHPPKIILKIKKEDIVKSDKQWLITIDETTSATGMKYMALLLHQGRPVKKIHQVFCLSFSIHFGQTVQVVAQKSPFFRHFSTGGSDHGQPFYIVISDTDTTIQVNTSYKSRGAIDIADSYTGKLRNLYMLPYTGQIENKGKSD